MNLLESLLDKGILDIPVQDFRDESLLKLASRFGKVIPGARNELVQLLPAREKGQGPIGSFSYSVGYGSFPWHTDTSYWDIPARFLLLASEDKSPCATLFQDLHLIRDMIPDFDYLLSRAVFLLDIPGQRRYLSPVFCSHGKKGIRLDYHIFRPANNEAIILNDLVNSILKDHFQRFVWTGHNAIIIDNWRMIHSRENAEIDRTRLLKRIYINELD